MKKHRIILSFLLFLSFIFSADINNAHAGKKHRRSKKHYSVKGAISKTPYIGAIAIDAASGKVLFDDNADAKAFPASITKLMNLLVVLDAVKANTITLEDKVTITREAAKTGGSQVYLREKEVHTVNDLLYALMIQSANDAAVALALHSAGSKEAFVGLMNKKAAEMGMKNTQFHTVHGLPPGKGQHPDISTARDIATFAQGVLKYTEVLEYTSVKERVFRPNSSKPFLMRNHNHLVGNFEGCDGLKTGYFQKAGFSIVATASQQGERVIAVVMGSTNRILRDSISKKILSEGLKELIKT